MSLKRLLIISCLLGLLIFSMIFFVITARRSPYPLSGGAVGMFFVAPVQDACVSTSRFVRDVWRHYFSLVSVSRENERLRRKLRDVTSKIKALEETALANQRLRRLLDFHEQVEYETFAAEVVARDPSGWFKTIIINKGSSSGVRRKMPVVVPEGIIGQVIDVSFFYSKVLLIIDQNSAVDALCQRSRARGVLQGGTQDLCEFKYVLRKEDVAIGDIVISSGMDGIYPKGLRLGRVSGVVKRSSGVFQDVEVEPLVNFDKLEEVLVVLMTPSPDEFSQ